MKFEFQTPTSVRLEHLNIRTEKHGEDDVTAIDLKLTHESSNEFLNVFAPGLQKALCYRSTASQAQGSIAGVEPLLPDLRFPELGPLTWDDEIVGARVAVAFGLTDVVLTDCTVDKVRLELLTGGSMATTFRVRTTNIPDGALDRLSRQLQGEVDITLTLPKEPSVKAVVTTKTPKPKGPDATELFAGAARTL
jgi:hypothetical protein